LWNCAPVPNAESLGEGSLEVGIICLGCWHLGRVFESGARDAEWKSDHNQILKTQTELEEIGKCSDFRVLILKKSMGILPHRMI